MWLAGVALAGLVGFALGNAHETGAALRGSGDWWQERCRQQVRQTVREHVAEDRETFGFSPEDLKAPVPAVKK